MGRNAGGNPNVMLDLPTWQVQQKPLKFPIPTQWPVANLHDNVLCNCRKPVQYHSGTGSLGTVYSHHHQQQWQNLSLPCAVSSETWMQLQSLITQLYRKICWSKTITWEEQKKRLGLVGCCHDYVTQVERPFQQLLIVHEKTELFAIS